jgi:hypothetical protein
LRDLFIKGVYNETYEVPTDGGPKCAAETTLGFKYMSGLLVLPFQLVIVLIGISYIARHHEKKKQLLEKTKRGLNPSILEYMQGILCFA